VVEEIDGVVKEFPEPREAPPVEAANQLIVPSEEVAPNVMVPAPQLEPGVLDEIVGVREVTVPLNVKSLIEYEFPEEDAPQA
jgi:hypothetical protein